MSTPPTILLVGGGSGGHICPNLAVVERLQEMGLGVTPHLVVSKRPLDAEIARGSGLDFTAIDAAPLVLRPKGLLRFWRDYGRGHTQVAKLIKQTHAAAVVATGGFVSGPAVAAARKAKPAGVPVALVSLDAVPGRANRYTARKATAVFSAFATHDGVRALQCPSLGGDAPVCGYPLRRAAVAGPGVSPAEARAHFGLNPDKRTLLIFAGSQGARTINRAMSGWYRNGNWPEGWQVLHVTGPGGQADTQVPEAVGKAIAYCDRMDLAWRASDAALTRAGAGTVAEAWANAVPSVMLPYPYHKDEHQKHNAAPMVELGGAVVVRDLIEPAANAAQLSETLGPIMADDAKRHAMAAALRGQPPRDGALGLAEWVREQVAG